MPSIVACIAAIFLILPLTAFAQPQLIPVMPYSEGADINERGDVVISSQSGPFIFSALGELTEVGFPIPTQQIRPYGINDLGDIVGYYRDLTGQDRGFHLTARGLLTTVDAPGGTRTEVTGINNSGEMVGFYEEDSPAGFRAIGFRLRNGVFQVIPQQDTPVLVPRDIDEDGTVIGFIAGLGGDRARGFVLTDGVMSFVDAPGATRTFLTGVAAGQFVGSADDRGFILRQGRFEFLPVVPFGINAAGVMTGVDFRAGAGQAFVWRRARHSLRITTPNNSSRWGLGTTQRLAWSYQGDAPQFKIEISRNGGDTWDFLEVVPNRPGPSQNFYWTVTGPSAADARLRVTAIGDEEATDLNDSDIRITEPFVEIVLPYRRTVTTLGTQFRIFFKHNIAARTPVAIEVSGDGGTTWRTIAERTATTGATTSSFGWTVDLFPTNRARVRARALDGSGASGVSAVFTVGPPQGPALEGGASPGRQISEVRVQAPHRRASRDAASVRAVGAMTCSAGGSRPATRLPIAL